MFGDFSALSNSLSPFLTLLHRRSLGLSRNLPLPLFVGEKDRVTRPKGVCDRRRLPIL